MFKFLTLKSFITTILLSCSLFAGAQLNIAGKYIDNANRRISIYDDSTFHFNDGAGGRTGGTLKMVSDTIFLKPEQNLRGRVLGKEVLVFPSKLFYDQGKLYLISEGKPDKKKRYKYRPTELEQKITMFNTKYHTWFVRDTE